MGQVTIYLDREVEAKMRAAAKAENLSQSKWIANIICDKVTDQLPKGVKSLAGSWSDSPSLDEIRDNEPSDTPRESW